MKPRLVIFVVLIILACILGVNCKSKKKAVVIGPIKGPDQVNENGTVSYTITVKNADNVKYDWTVEPITAGLIIPLDEAAASFTPYHVTENQSAAIKVGVTIGGGDPEVKTKQITILDNDQCLPDIIEPLTDIIGCPTTVVTEADISLQIAASDNCTAVQDLVVVWEIYKDSELQSNGEEANMTLLPIEGLTSGLWEARVWSRDEKGNEDQTPAVCTFEVPIQDNPPNTSIVSGCEDYPPGTNLVTLVVKGTDDLTPVADLTFEWNLLKDGNPEIGWTPSSSTTIIVSGLTDGSTYKFSVRAIDGKGQVDPSPTSCNFDILPNEPPDTQIVSGCQPSFPQETTQVIFEVTGTDDYTPVADLTFEWQLYTNGVLTTDWAAAANTSITVNGLAEGNNYEFKVRAVDGLGAQDESPASCMFTVAANQPPNTQIVSGCQATLPQGTTQVVFTVTGTDDATPIASLTYEWRFYTGGVLTTDWTAASTSITVNGLVDGENYEFNVRAVDEKSAKDPTPAACTFSVGANPCDTDAVPPNTQITSGCQDYPAGTTSIMLGVSGTDNCTSFSNLAFEWESYSNYSILVQPWTMAYTNPISIFPLYSGHWQVYVRAVDEKNNKDNSPALCEFNIG